MLNSQCSIPIRWELSIGQISPPCSIWHRDALSCPQIWEATVDFTNYVLSILISLILGLGGFFAAYKLFDWLTPGVNFGDQLNADNRAVAIFLAGLFIGLGLLL